MEEVVVVLQEEEVEINFSRTSLISRLFYFITIILFISYDSYSQYGYYKDVIKFSHSFQGGSARIQGVGGASVSLGGDVSSISQNPAGLGFINRKLISVGYGVTGNNSTSNFFGESSTVKNNYNQIENISLVLPIRNKNNYLGNSISKCPECSKFNIGFSYSKIKDFSERKFYRGYNDVNSIIDYFLQDSQGVPLSQLGNNEMIPDIALLQEAYDHYLINPDNDLPGSYFSFIGGFPLQEEEIITEGSINKVSVSAGSNIRDKIFLGFGFNFYSIDYDQRRFYLENNFEVLDDAGQWNFEGILDYLNLNDVFKISGSGASVSAGLIIKPSNSLNIGISYESKTSFNLEEELYSELETKYFDYYYEPEDTILRNVISGTGSTIADYSYKSPSRITIGSSYFYKKFGFISAEIDLIDYSSAQIQSYDFNDYVENAEILRIYRTLAINYRVGLEARLNKFYLRLGYNFLADPEKDIINSSHSNALNKKSIGVGFLSNILTADITFTSINKKSVLSPYNLFRDQPVAEFDSNFSKIIFSLGIRINN